MRFLFMRFDRNVSETLAAAAVAAVAVAGRPAYPPHTNGIIIIKKNERTTIKTPRSINRPRRRNHPGSMCECVCVCARVFGSFKAGETGHWSGKEKVQGKRVLLKEGPYIEGLAAPSLIPSLCPSLSHSHSLVKYIYIYTYTRA